MIDLIFCLPIIFGCPTRIKPEGDMTPRICPRCRNASVVSAKSRQWFELCWVPLIPMKSKRVWVCAICQWMMPIQGGWQPEVAGAYYQPPQQQAWAGPPQQNWGQYPPGFDAGFQPGYQPQYANPNHKTN